MCGFIAQLVEHHTGIAEVTGSNPVDKICDVMELTTMIKLSFQMMLEFCSGGALDDLILGKLAFVLLWTVVS